LPGEKNKLKDSVTAVLYDSSGKIKNKVSSQKEDRLLKLFNKLLEWLT